ncbi:MAG TPA: xanthine dehydrogenase family protein subunit M [bacterium]|nr:xanthine dehydrogenase family protein subunit M [bacterium]
MFAEKFEYHVPGSLAEATQLLSQYGDEAKVITGGMSLIPLMKLRLAMPSHLVDLRKLADLKGVRESGGKLVIGAGMTYDEVSRDKTVLAKCPVLAQAAAVVGDVQVRNRGTIGGALVHADPAADVPAAAIALEAEVTLQGKQQRTVKVSDFIVDSLLTSIEPDEVLVSITVPVTGRHTAYAKLPQQASGYPLVGVAAVLEMDGKTCKRARIGVTGLCGKAFRAASVEEALAGKTLDAASIKAAADALASDITDPLEDPLNGSVEYRAHVAKVYTGRALQQAMGA